MTGQPLSMPTTWQDVEQQIAAVQGKQVLFITGAAKSGTTWVQLMLDAHPQIACRGEGSFFEKFAGGLQGLCAKLNEENTRNLALKDGAAPPFPTIELPLVMHLLRQTVLGSLATYGAAPETRVIAEKTPSTVLGLEAVLACFPDARILHVVRDGRDVCLSAWHHNLRDPRGDIRAYYPTFSDFLPFMTGVWLKHQRPILAAQVEHSARVRAIRYEDLLTTPDRVLDRVCQWLDVETAPETLAACIQASDFKTLSGGRSRGEEDQSSFFRSGTAGGWRDHLSAAEADAYWTQAGDEMTALGYAR